MVIQDKVRCRFGDVYKIFGWKGAEKKRRDVGVWSHERHVRNAAKWRSSQESKKCSKQQKLGASPFPPNFVHLRAPGGAVNARSVCTPTMLICTVVGLLHARAYGGLS